MINWMTDAQIMSLTFHFVSFLHKTNRFMLLCVCLVIHHRRHQLKMQWHSQLLPLLTKFWCHLQSITEQIDAQQHGSYLLHGKYSTWSIWSKKSSCIAGACSLPGTIWLDQGCDKTTCLQCKSEIETLLRLQLFPQRLSQKSLTTMPTGIMGNNSFNFGVA